MNYKMKVVIEDPNTKEGMTSEIMYNLDCFFVYDEEQYGKKTYLSISTEDGHFDNYYDLRYDEHYNRNEKEKYLEYWARNYWSGENGSWIVKEIDIVPTMKEFKTVEEMRNDEELQYMGRYEWRKVKVNKKEVFACTTDQQYEDIICGGICDMLYNLFRHFNISTEDMFVSDFIPDMRDLILGNLKENGIEFVNIYEEY